MREDSDKTNYLIRNLVNENLRQVIVHFTAVPATLSVRIDGRPGIDQTRTSFDPSVAYLLKLSNVFSQFYS